MLTCSIANSNTLEEKLLNDFQIHMNMNAININVNVFDRVKQIGIKHVMTEFITKMWAR